MSSMSSGEIIDAARERTGLGPFEEASYHEGLELLVAEIAACDRATERSYAMMRGAMTDSLANRFRVEDYLIRHPEICEAPVERPVFMFGMPRTGTTLANHLLGTDPARRSLLNWEAVDSIPPATTATLKTDPRCLAALKRQEEMLERVGDLVLPHWEYADEPTECIFLLAQDFKAMSWESRLPMPGYSKWILECDMAPAYAYHKKCLQILQSRAPGIWNLKMPSHSIWIDTILELYPDARLIWTHRDPYKTFASSCSLTLFSQTMAGVDPLDPVAIGDNATRRLGAHLRGAMAAKKRLGDRIYDLYYHELVADPVGEMRKLYAWLEDPFDEDVAGRMQAYLDDHPQNKFGRHEYTLEEFGLSVEKLRPLFADYLERFSMPVAAG